MERNRFSFRRKGNNKKDKCKDENVFDFDTLTYLR